MSKTTISEGYNKYYANDGDGISVYNSRFGEARYNAREEAILRKQILKKVEQLKAQDKNTIRILDFGCGDGRLFPIIYQLAEELAAQNFQIIFSGCDISDEGLRVFNSNLTRIGFRQESSDEDLVYDPSLNQLKRLSNLTEKNLEINLWCITPETKRGEILEQMGNYDITICMFGTLSHIIGAVNRQNVLGTLALQSDDLVLTVPSRNIFKSNQEIFRGKRANGEDFEEGDIEYEVKDGNGKVIAINPYHLYTRDELEKDLKIAGFGQMEFEADTISNPIELTKRPMLAMVETSILSQIGGSLKDHGCYILLTAKSSKEIEMRKIPRTNVKAPENAGVLGAAKTMSEGRAL
jgi:SAM-dependent methyltransferase